MERYRQSIPGNSVIPADGCVISVHGTAADAFAGVKAGDKAGSAGAGIAVVIDAVDIMGPAARGWFRLGRLM